MLSDKSWPASVPIPVKYPISHLTLAGLCTAFRWSGCRRRMGLCCEANSSQVWTVSHFIPYFYHCSFLPLATSSPKSLSPHTLSSGCASPTSSSPHRCGSVGFYSGHWMICPTNPISVGNNSLEHEVTAPFHFWWSWSTDSKSGWFLRN